MRRPYCPRKVLLDLAARGVHVTAIGGSRWALSVPRGTTRLVLTENRRRARPWPLAVRLERFGGGENTTPSGGAQA